MKILLIEDDRDTSQLLSATLTAQHYAVDAIADGLSGLELAANWSYDLILLDVMLPELNGIELCHQLRNRGCQTPILMLTVKDSDEDIIAGLDAGADDYVAKSCTSAQLLARVRALLRRSETAGSSPVLTWGELCLDPALVQVTYRQSIIPLRAKEYSLLELFLRHPQHILSRSAIIDHLWSIDETPVEGSVTNLIKDLRHRLKSVGIDDFIETVYGLGYRLKAAPQFSLVATHPALAIGQNTERGRAAIEKITQRFRLSIEQRIAVLEAAERSLRLGNFTVQQQIAAQTEAHNLAGGLGTFGCMQTSKTAQAIEQWLERSGNESYDVNQFARLLKQLKQELADSNQPELVAVS
ncbi:response regulator transcription factor [Leptolyngbya sp. NIES-2104]|uniref:response regulator transcription factor n=1 Tax=Leptolyngbya sp. NIES-2104 TaxID=1552121 RepID=UPI0006ECB39F|nr:response regulator transcription factor [Leptolyngbya sp. NIES-2104]GAP98989.1 two component transcriptional regulator, winged helix family protein [Leptolyngbya sp. NIES-2104]